MAGYFVAGNFGQLSWRPEKVIPILEIMTLVTVEGFFAKIYSIGGRAWDVAITAIYLVLLVYSTSISRKNLWIWLTGAVWILLNALTICLSNRTDVFGIVMAFAHRYYFELTFLFVICLNLLFAESVPTDRLSNLLSKRWARITISSAGAA